MTKKDAIEKFKILIQRYEAEVEICKGNDSKLEQYYKGKVDAYKAAVIILSGKVSYEG